MAVETITSKSEDKVTCTINGQQVQVPKGSCIIEAFKFIKEDIAHYCWHPGLSVAGVCRLCMVSIEGNPKLQIACNTKVSEGMVISNQTKDVKQSVKWGMEFHLINHPLDCPICDQAGECELQEQYMKFGLHVSKMAQKKVKKNKMIDLGSTIVLDSERCILCSRCVRFTEEITKTHELGIFQRGDRSEIGTVSGKPLDNNYSVNTVDICPVGALTSKNFRFKQRVWYLQEKATICHGCSTGCSINAFYNEEGIFRVKPRLNPEVNDYWMCDKGRNLFEKNNPKNRLSRAQICQSGKSQVVQAGHLVMQLKERLDNLVNPSRVALVLGSSYSNEEYEAILTFWKNKFDLSQVFAWPQSEDHKNFDELLFRGERNSNSEGLKQALAKQGVNTQWSCLEKMVQKGTLDTLIVAAPENQEPLKQSNVSLASFEQVPHLVWLGVQLPRSVLEFKNEVWLIPARTFFAKEGTYTNFSG